MTDDHPVLVLPASPAGQSESLRAVGSARSNTSGSGLFSLADHPGRDRLVRSRLSIRAPVRSQSKRNCFSIHIPASSPPCHPSILPRHHSGLMASFPGCIAGDVFDHTGSLLRRLPSNPWPECDQAPCQDDRQSACSSTSIMMDISPAR